MKELIYSLYILFHPCRLPESKYIYFSTRRRKLYICTLFLLFGMEVVIFVLGFMILGDTFNLILSKNIAFIITVSFSIALFTAIRKLENFSNYLKEQDKKEIRKELSREIKKIKTNKLNAIDFLITLKEENEVVKRTLEDNKEPTLTVNLVNTALGFIGGYYFNNIRSYEKIEASALIFLLIVFLILYSYFILEITKASKLYLLELYNYQISYVNRLIKRYRK